MPALLSVLASVTSPEALDRAALVCCARVRQLVALSVSAIAGAAKMTKEVARIRDFIVLLHCFTGVISGSFGVATMYSIVPCYARYLALNFRYDAAEIAPESPRKPRRALRRTCGWRDHDL